jgi:hypothetical protein
VAVLALHQHVVIVFALVVGFADLRATSLNLNLSITYLLQCLHEKHNNQHEIISNTSRVHANEGVPVGAKNFPVIWRTQTSTNTQNSVTTLMFSRETQIISKRLLFFIYVHVQIIQLNNVRKFKFYITHHYLRYRDQPVNAGKVNYQCTPKKT